MTIRNKPDHAIQPVYLERFSPYSFDPAATVDASDVAAVFEAARWAMSSYNEQPWRYIVGARGRSDEVRERILAVLVEPNRVWATHAPILVLGLYSPQFEHNGKPNNAAQHDLGAASACLTIEAGARGLMVHQMSGILPDEARESFALSHTYIPLTALAIGRPGRNPALPDDYASRDERERTRRPIDESILLGGF